MARYPSGQTVDDEARRLPVPPSQRHPALDDHACRTILRSYRTLEKAAKLAVRRCGHRQMEPGEARRTAFMLRHHRSLIRINDALPERCTPPFLERISRLDGNAWDRERLRRAMEDSRVAIGLLDATASPQYPRLAATFSPAPQVPDEPDRRGLVTVLLLFVGLPLLIILLAVIS